jgi:hypothetical protein
MTISGGEYRNMGARVFWEVFENTGFIEAYLIYSKNNEEVVSNSSVDSEKIENNSLEGEE